MPGCGARSDRQDSLVAPPEKTRTEDFIRLLTLYQPRVYLFILSLLPNRSDADEVIQETNLLLWERFAEFQPGSDFRAWAFQVAYFKVKQFRDRQQRSRICFGDAFMERLTEVAAAEPDDYDVRQEALAECLQKLSDKDRRLVDARYQPGATATTVAEQLGRSTEAVYKSMQRLRQTLYDCIQRQLLAEDRP